MILHKILENKIDMLIKLCQAYNIKRLYVYGSIVTEHFNIETSDLDFIVETESLPPLEKGEVLMNFWISLEKLFSRKVDLLTEQSIKNPFLKKSIEETKQLIYDRQSEKISFFP